MRITVKDLAKDTSAPETPEEIINQALRWANALLREAEPAEAKSYHQAIYLLNDSHAPLKTRLKQARDILELVNIYFD